MTKNLLTILIAFLIGHLVNGQDHRDWPSSLNYFSYGDDMTSYQICAGNEVIDREIISETFGIEYYCNGNVHAEGPIKKLKSETVIYIKENNKKVLTTEYVRNGYWRVYFDSTSKILRSEGKFKDGEKHGKWTIYSESGKVLYEFDYLEGQLKSKIVRDQNGNLQTIIKRSDANLFVKRNEVVLILLGVLPIVLFRISWNILTYNKINNTNYIPMLQNWQKGGWSVNIYCTFIFWWVIKEEDKEEVQRFKRIGNWISVLSFVCLITVMLIFGLYGENK